MYFVKIVIFWVSVVKEFECEPVQEWGCESHAVNAIKHTSMPWQYGSTIFDITASFDEAFDQITHDGQHSTYKSQEHVVKEGHLKRILALREMSYKIKASVDYNWGQESSYHTFPCLFRWDALDEWSFAKDASKQKSSDIRELGHVAEKHHELWLQKEDHVPNRCSYRDKNMTEDLKEQWKKRKDECLIYELLLGQLHF